MTLQSYCREVRKDMLLTPMEGYLLARALGARCSIMTPHACVRIGEKTGDVVYLSHARYTLRKAHSSYGKC